jgi:dipeptidase E
MLLSNSFSPGQGALEHAMDALADFFAGVRQVLFIPYAASDLDGYAEAMREILGRLGVRNAAGPNISDAGGAWTRNG